MVDLSLDTGQIQDIWKEALVRSTEKDYRAVSNLTFVSKVTEKHEETQRACTVSIPESSIQFLIILL